MTALLASLALLLGSAFPTDSTGPSGVYQAPNAAPEAWQINDHHSLLWNGEPYLPVGVRIEGTPERIDAAKAAGIQDVIVELPASGDGWADAFQALEKDHLRYLVALNSIAPMAHGITVEPAGYRIDGITEPQHVDLSFPAAKSVLTILATRRDGSVEQTSRVQTPAGHFVQDVKPMNDLEHVLLMYPEQASLEQPDFWDRLDAQRDGLIAAFRRTPPGKGFRGLINPMGTMLRVKSPNVRFVPTSPYFRLELASYLETKYRSLDTALRTWSMSVSDIDSFEKLARLVPLWSGTRGIPEYWDPTTDKLYPSDSGRSLAWRDIDDVISIASERRFKRMVAAIRSVVNVPIIQDWAGWSAPYETADPAIDGVGVRVDSSSPSVISDEAGKGASTILRWTKPGWAPATEISLGSDKAVGEDLPAVLDDLSSLGVRGWFVRSEDPAVRKALVAEAAKRSGNTLLAGDSPKALFYPESATNPAMTQLLPGGYWWLPSPAAGNRIDLGSNFFAYRLEDRNGPMTVIWTAGKALRVRLRATEPKLLQFTTIDGSDPKPKLLKNAVEVQLSQTPLIITGTDEIPIPEPALLETDARFQELSKLAEAQQKDISDDRYFYQDNLHGFERNPGGSFLALRLVIQKMKMKLAPYDWIEAESCRDTNFSEATSVAGASGGGVLSLHSELNDRVYTADYSVPVRSEQEQEVWIAAKIPPSLRNRLRVLIGGQTLTIAGDGVSPYGQGYAWYRLGTTRLAGNSANVRIEATSEDGAEIDLDVLMITPGAFRPNGVEMPAGLDAKQG